MTDQKLSDLIESGIAKAEEAGLDILPKDYVTTTLSGDVCGVCLMTAALFNFHTLEEITAAHKEGQIVDLIRSSIKSKFDEEIGSAWVFVCTDFDRFDDPERTIKVLRQHNL